MCRPAYGRGEGPTAHMGLHHLAESLPLLMRLGHVRLSGVASARVPKVTEDDCVERISFASVNQVAKAYGDRSAAVSKGH